MADNLPKNSQRQVKLPGILGGLGPLAHIEFEQRLLHHSARRGTQCDQEHPNWLLLSAASTPDRTQSLTGTGPDCVPYLVRSACLLEAMGAGFLVVTCNTAHGFYHTVQAQLDIPWLHMMEATAAYIAQCFPNVRQVGVLATDGTLRSQLYTTSLAQYGISPILPPLGSPIQHRIMEAIYSPDWGIKATGAWVSDIALIELIVASRWLAAQGAELLIAGCTEISIGLAQLSQLPINWIDPLDIMANLTLDLAYGIISESSTVSVKSFP
ncbi:aspartate/glutamate racemase family protein [Leptolyngbyaceae cyanobacterium CCMR0082]|uniref:Aspartate/glutamate racemase family protein n=2 Tax=Adonisia turfae TaxID=2950184 RepID=A0A6M0SHL7_9CYAN|nr:amino acid racemase [Adonisia turfae]MDV3348214.1 amino acid racemase [Leptothoe sp. LEGE 181152]NEZ55299.1 aspartate/glutamate racemase family protein [Adonisia turfae CCMR0081]NEZ67461.1 aspartate/glutamate racemase family protein [Adonisia turfae CCMR0082]